MKPTFKPSSKIVQSEDILIKELDGEAVLLNLKNNQYYRLDTTSLRMYQVVLSSTNLETAAVVLKCEYDVTAEQLWDDLTGFVADLERAGVVRVINE